MAMKPNIHLIVIITVLLLAIYTENHPDFLHYELANASQFVLDFMKH